MPNTWREWSLVLNVAAVAKSSGVSERSKRAMARSGWTNPFVTVTPVSVIFFPQRLLLKLDGRAYSPLVLERIVSAGGLAKSFDVAAKLLKLVGEINVCSRQVNNLTVMVGEELARDRDRQTAAYIDQPLPRTATRVEPIPQLACVEVDGGRMQTRTAGEGPGVHEAHWRETKTAGFFRMKTTSHATDPHPALPRCFADRKQMQGLLPGVGDESADIQPVTDHDPSWRPKVLFRTCCASLETSERFGPMMAAEADARGFFAAQRRAFLADGLPYNWSIQRKHFPTFEPIVDFVHPVERLYAAARAMHEEHDSAWPQYVAWAGAVWQGQVSEVIQDLAACSQSLGPPPQDAEELDPRRVLVESLTYLRNNQSRMDYPRYRRQGLPVTSALIESLVKEMNYRVKGSEKFWNDGLQGEAILQVRAALLSDDDRLAAHIRQRPGQPYARTSRKTSLATAA
jgi:hypothetical protein